MGFLKRLVIAASALLLLSCNEGGTNFDGTIDVGSYFDVNTYALNKLVCDPFDGGGQQDPNGGLKANLYYLEDGTTPLNSVHAYISDGIKSDKHIFFSQLNVPTRLFDLGFPTQTGSTISKNDGETLVENFAMEIDTVIKLGPNDEPGLYELALLSDDGSILQVRENGTFVDIVNNDGVHPTRMGCASRGLYMNAGDSYLAKIYYYQGPRHHISVIPMWRKISDESEVGSDPSCGKEGNSMYFDYNNNSEPKPAYTNLLARGWKPLSTDNYELPQGVLYNPCVEGEAPTITNVFIEDLLDGQLHVTWTTDLPATSQVRVVNMDTGEEVLTYSDNVFRTNHDVYIHNIRRNVNYLIQAVSVSQTYGKSISFAYNVRIQ